MLPFRCGAVILADLLETHTPFPAHDCWTPRPPYGVHAFASIPRVSGERLPFSPMLWVSRLCTDMGKDWHWDLSSPYGV